MLHPAFVVGALLIGMPNAQLLVQEPVDFEEFAKDFAGSEHLEAAVTIGSLSSPSLCDASVKQHSGYLNVTDDSSYFFWMFESRSSPSKDPVVMWLSGGPGCSSMLAALKENGPCNVAVDGKVTKNDFSWNNKANLIYLDQPSGTGFSTGSPTDHDEGSVAQKVYNFMQGFYKALPQYKQNDFFIFGESYAGHYVPAVSHFIWQQGKSGNDFKIPLKGLGIGNGLTDPEEQYKWYPEMAKDGGKNEGGTLEAGVVTNWFQQWKMNNAVKSCIPLIAACNEGNQSSACKKAYAQCNSGVLYPYMQTGYNQYDMRIKCEKPPLCYDFSGIGDFLNLPATQSALGVTKKWASCSMPVNAAFQGDYMKNYQTMLPDMLADGIKVIIYAGDVDFICNWLGNKKWTLALEWPHKGDFNAAMDENITIDGKAIGRLRSSNGLQFMQIFQAGHMAPFDQPAAALEMLNSFVGAKSPALVV